MDEIDDLGVGEGLGGGGHGLGLEAALETEEVVQVLAGMVRGLPVAGEAGAVPGGEVVQLGAAMPFEDASLPAKWDRSASPSVPSW